MKLVEALQITRAMGKRDGEPLVVVLACGFTPLHVQTFLAAHLALFSPTRRNEIRVGLFGDLLGNVDRLRGQKIDAAAVVIEWSDLDPRLGLRSLGGWLPSDLPDILATAADRLDRLRDSLNSAAATMPIAVSLPTLPLPPMSYTPGWQSGGFELDLRASLTRFAAEASRSRNVRIANAQRLDQTSPLSERLDVRAELLNGFPYTVGHASIVAEALARLIAPPPPKKGLITDLDDTFWRGILGEVGVAGINWHLDYHTQAHGLYQQLLASLAGAGILVAVASKNESALVEEAFGRRDLVIDASKVFPREAHWEAKSGSVARILETWNIGADSVVFVDDSPMELAEVKAAFPDVECLPFPTHDDRAIYNLLGQLRDLFGKPALSREDAIRLDSLRSAAAAKREASSNPSADPDRLLTEARPVIRISFDKEPVDSRALELVNKTNQFNLNGRRFADAAWFAYLADPSSFLLRVAYEDKFGPLGTIAVLGGRVEASVAFVDFWVMSCRAFSRRIEHRALKAVFEKFGVDAIIFDYEETPRNRPVRDALASMTETISIAGLRLDRAMFARHCPTLPHRIMDWTNE